MCPLSKLIYKLKLPFTFLLLVIFLHSDLIAQTKLVKDINEGSESGLEFNTWFVNSNKLLYFLAYTNGGQQLFRTDGTNTGTFSVLLPNTTCTSYSVDVKDVNGILYFRAINTITKKPGIYKTDGTVTGTKLVKEIDATFFGSLNNTLFFSCADLVNGQELWKTDGTEEGTMLVKDINPGAGSSYPSDYAVYKNELYFVAFEPTVGFEIWKTDGSADGTFLLKDILPSNEAVYNAPTYFCVANNLLFFRANDGVHGGELWKTDGTREGTQMVKDLLTKDTNPIPGSNPFMIRKASSGIYFIARGDDVGVEIFKSDGTAEGTICQADFIPGPNTSLSITNVDEDINGTIYFLGEKDRFSNRDLFKIGMDGKAVTLMKKPMDSRFLKAFKGSIFTGSVDMEHGNELWKTDLSGANTVLVSDINKGPQSSFYSGFAELNDKLFFIAYNGANGSELWVYQEGIPILPPINIKSQPNATIQICSNSNDQYLSVNSDGISLEYHWQYLTKEGIWKNILEDSSKVNFNFKSDTLQFLTVLPEDDAKKFRVVITDSLGFSNISSISELKVIETLDSINIDSQCKDNQIYLQADSLTKYMNAGYAYTWLLNDLPIPTVSNPLASTAIGAYKMILNNYSTHCSVVSNEISLESISCEITVVKNSQSGNDFLLFPNPFGDVFTIKFPSEIEEYKVEIIDLKGRLVNSFTTKSIATVNLNNVNSGIYLIKILYGNEVWTTRLNKY